MSEPFPLTAEEALKYITLTYDAPLDQWVVQTPEEWDADAPDGRSYHGTRTEAEAVIQEIASTIAELNRMGMGGR